MDTKIIYEHINLQIEVAKIDNNDIEYVLSMERSKIYPALVVSAASLEDCFSEMKKSIQYWRRQKTKINTDNSVF